MPTMRKSTFLTPKPLDLEKAMETFEDDDCASVTSRRSSYTMRSSVSGNGSNAGLLPKGEEGPSRSSTLTTIVMILLLGLATSGAFIGFGVTTAQDEISLEFTRAAVATTNKIHSAFEDYVTAASMIHLRCRHRNFTRQDFRETYEYVISTGLSFKSGQFAPMITHSERDAAEAEQRAFLAENYPDAEAGYQGFRGFNYANSTSLEPRIEQPFYFPIHYQEPIPGNEAAIDLDYHSSESRTRAVDALFETKAPSMTDRLSLVKKAGQVSRCGNHNGPSFGVVIMHPGVPLDTPQAGDEVWPRDFAAIVLCVPDLLTRSTSDQSKGSLIYIHDRSTPGQDAVFMGGAKVTTIGDDENGEPQVQVDFVDEMDMAELSAERMEQSNVTAANRVWTVTVLSIEGTYEPEYLFVVLGGSVVFVASVFLAIWVYTNARRQEQYMKVLTAAERSTAIVTSLFPKNVAKQMMDYDASDQDGNNSEIKSKPIADLFPATTVMFADMEGFTAWSSQRDPISVFTLLETVYNAFDEIAAKKKVFKVETVGDCYVACCGLPEANSKHAVIMASFAQSCARKVKVVMRALEVELGPETSALGFRFGLHSGPVTGGVLRGQRARFQLFGDTVNTAARIESTGKKGKIQISTATANLLRDAGKGHWVMERDDRVLAKGIGVLSTCWLSVRPSKLSKDHDADASNGELSSHGEASVDEDRFRDNQVGLVDWHTQSLAQFLKVVVAQQHSSLMPCEDDRELTKAEQTIIQTRRTPIEEISDNIAFPHVDDLEGIQEDSESIELGMRVHNQLRNFIWEIAGTYKAVPFHNFEHASHVVMSVLKLLGSASNHKDDGLDDPLARFTLVLAAIVHDADHSGVPNGQLNKENDRVAVAYDYKSAAEQNSLDITWNLLMKDEYKDLRRTIYTNETDLQRFRGLLVHTVLITDIVNKDLQSQRKVRWNRIFGSADAPVQETAPNMTSEEQRNERRTALLELVIQASDVSHTMQHWHIFRQWNTCLFHEMLGAYQAGRADKDPREEGHWFKGEIGFFKFYILPLADRVKHSSAFGALGAELYQCAESNLYEWEMKGEMVCAELLESSGGKNFSREHAVVDNTSKPQQPAPQFISLPETDVMC